MDNKRPTEPPPGAHQHKAPGQPGYPQEHAMEELRRRQVTRIRKLKRMPPGGIML